MDYNHKRILRIRLLLIESHLCDIISELESDTTNSTLILYSVRNNMSSEIRIQILSTVNSMLDEIRHMKENFALESEEKSIRSNIWGHLQAIWTTL
jgi:predicted ATP-dependent serine protease